MLPEKTPSWLLTQPCFGWSEKLSFFFVLMLCSVVQDDPHNLTLPKLLGLLESGNYKQR